jgi:hypothetical protein
VRPREATISAGGIGVHARERERYLAEHALIDEDPANLDVIQRAWWEGFLDSYDKIARPLGLHLTRR